MRDLGGASRASSGLDHRRPARDPRGNTALEQLHGLPESLLIVGGRPRDQQQPRPARPGPACARGLQVAGVLEIRDDDRLVDLSGLPAGLQLGIDLRERRQLAASRPTTACSTSPACPPASPPPWPAARASSGNPGLSDLSGLFGDLAEDRRQPRRSARTTASSTSPACLDPPPARHRSPRSRSLPVVADNQEPRAPHSATPASLAALPRRPRNPAEPWPARPGPASSSLAPRRRRPRPRPPAGQRPRPPLHRPRSARR